MGGVPARQLKTRLPMELASEINNSEWWNWTDEKISEMAAHFDDPERFLMVLERGKTK